MCDCDPTPADEAAPAIVDNGARAMDHVVQLWQAVGTQQFETMAAADRMDSIERAVRLVAVGLICTSLSLLMLSDQGRG